MVMVMVMVKVMVMVMVMAMVMVITTVMVMVNSMVLQVPYFGTQNLQALMYENQGIDTLRPPSSLEQYKDPGTARMYVSPCLR